jgi:DNA-directed RNA polymerase subunit RPC12/RpoP
MLKLILINFKSEYIVMCLQKDGELLMSGKNYRTYSDKCVDCGSPLELYEIDFDKSRRIMQCTQCGLYHFYKKDFLGKWKLVKAGRVSDLWRKPK